jgi:hypothetical protein
VPTVWRSPWKVSPGPTRPPRLSLAMALMKVELKSLSVHGVPLVVAATVTASWYGADASRSAKSG